MLRINSTVVYYFCSPPHESGQTPSSKKISVLPIQLSINGAGKDTLIQHYFKEAFARYKIELISPEEAKLRMEDEAKRAASKVFTKGANFNGTDDMIRKIGQEHRYVLNRLSITLEIQPKDDSLFIFKAGWSNIPFPPNIAQPSSGTRFRNIDLTNLSYSIKENVKSIVDSILYSKELK
jgi:hypothetical protein